ncbi:hypothetical protein ACFL6R_00350 [Gemmatimonadota bacterium]
MPRYLYILSFLLLTACSQQLDNQDHAFRVYDRDGVTIAETEGGPKYPGEVFTYERIMTLQGDESDPESLLHLPEPAHSPTSFTVDESGFFYLADTNNHRIAVFRPDGTFERSFGREGEGPGDLRSPRLIVEQNGKLRIQDSNRRTTLFATDGSLVGIIQFNRGGNSIWEHGDYIVDIRSRSNPPDYTTLRSEALVKNTGGDTLAVISTPEVMIAAPVPTIVRLNNSRRIRPINLQYSASPLILHLRTSEFLLYAGSEPELMFHDQAGTLIRRIVLDIPQMPVSSDEQKLVKDRLNELMRLAITDPGVFPIEMNPADIPFADVKAPWQAVEVDDHGYIWLQESLPVWPFDPAGAETVVYRLLSPEGEYLGDTHRPMAVNGQVVRGYFLALVNDEELGTAVPVVYRISSAVRGFKYPN